VITHNSIENFNKSINTAITIGTFDGVHIGHKKIIERIVATAKGNGLESAILTFYPHPRMVLQQDTDLKLLTTIEEKQAILKETGLDHLIVQPFTKEFSRLTALEFIKDILVDGLNTKKIIIGYDHRFGRNRTANIKDLIEYGNTFNFEVEEISAQEINDVSVSSTKIRKALHEGNVTTANSYLGYPYLLTGTITKGKGLGRQLQFPTANLHIDNTYKLIPKKGSYVVKSIINQTTVFGMMNIGFNPTVNGTQQTIEINFFDFNADLYNKTLQVSLLSRLRDEQKFDSVEALQHQLQLDKQQALQFIEKHHAQ
jgi:riboflavin kinase/FMN adenylyltransferase